MTTESPHDPHIVDSPFRVGIDIGGVLSKYPRLRVFVDALLASPLAEVHILTDIPDHAKAVRLCHDNGIPVPPERIHSCDYERYGEECKAVKAQELHLDMILDDFMSYLSIPGAPAVRLLVMPDPSADYCHPGWKTDPAEATWGRHKQFGKPIAFETKRVP